MILTIVVILVVLIPLWIAPIFIADALGRPKGHRHAWIWGCVLGWVGVAVVALQVRDVAVSTPSGGAVAAPRYKGLSSATQEGASSAVPASRGRVDVRRLVRRHGWTVGVYVLLLILILYWRSATTVPWGPFDVQTLALDLVPLAFAACGQAIVIISGGIDLSIGSLMALINVIAARWMVHMSFREALLYAVALVFLGALAGALTGLIIVFTRVADIIVTLAMLFIWYGAALAILATPGGGAPEGFTNLTNIDTWGTTWAPAALVILVVTVGVIWIPIRRSRAGLALYAVGSNRTAAYLAGVNVSRARIAAYALGGTFAALGGLAITSASGGLGDPNAGATSGFTLQSVAAAVLGGVSLLGGVGGLIGPMAAACALSLVPTILVLKGQDPGWATVIQGVLIVVVMMIGGLALRQKGKTGT